MPHRFVATALHEVFVALELLANRQADKRDREAITAVAERIRATEFQLRQWLDEHE